MNRQDYRSLEVGRPMKMWREHNWPACKLVGSDKRQRRHTMTVIRCACALLVTPCDLPTIVNNCPAVDRIRRFLFPEADYGYHALGQNRSAHFSGVCIMNLSRRTWITSSAVAAVSVLSQTDSQIVIGAMAADPVKRPGTPMLKLSLAGYSFNKMFAKRGTPDEIAKAEMSLEKFIDFCAAQELGATELTGYYFPKVITTEYLLSLRAQTHRLGLSISGTAIGNDFCLAEGDARQKQLAECREWIDYAAIMGAPAIRIFAGKVPKDDTEDAAIERCVAGINECLKYAATKGIFLALENHGGITSTPEQMFMIIEKVDASPWFGVNFDSGNFQTDDPYTDLAKIAPYAVNAQIKASISPGGKKQPADFERIVKILKDSGYRGFVALEYEESESPFEAIPRILDQLRPLIGSP